MFKLSLAREELKSYVLKQVDTFFPDHWPLQHERLFDSAFSKTLERVEYCFQHIALKGYSCENSTYFSHLHSDQYSMFLWFLSNSVWKEFEDESLASKLFCLNKTLNGLMCMYDALMPDIFLIVHGTGTVLGKASYSNFFVVYHGCTVGAVHGVYPSFGLGVALAPQSTVVGKCVIGNHVTIGTQAFLRNENVKSNSLYYKDIGTGQSGIKTVANSWAQSFFRVPIPETTGDDNR